MQGGAFSIVSMSIKEIETTQLVNYKSSDYDTFLIIDIQHDNSETKR